MTCREPSRPVELAVHELETLERDGRSERTLRVFCPLRHESADVRSCAGCEFARQVSDVRVACEPPVAFDPRDADREGALLLGPDAKALRTPLGAVCAPHSVAVRVDVPLAQAVALLTHEKFVVVLTSDDQVCGVLSAAEPPRQASVLDGADGAAGGTWSSPHGTDGPFRVLPESAPLSEAIELMVRGHVRLVAVTGESRRFVGLVTDLDILRWAADTRRS